MALPLEGIRILDLSVWQQGTYATAMLADMGADVIKIESYVNPDPGRGLNTLIPGKNAYFNTLNRGKRSLLLDLKTEAGQEVFWKLVETADVFHNNMRYGVMERLGVTWEKLQEVNPRCILSNATGWGHLGPDAYSGAMDTLAQARGGIMSVTGEGADSPPTVSGVPQADHVGAIISGYGILLALMHRERTGEAQEVNTSLYGSQLCIQSYNITSALWTGIAPPRMGHTDRRPTWNSFQGSDGKWFMIGALPPDKWWRRFCEVMGTPELCAGEFATVMGRMDHNLEIISRMDEVFATRTRDEWVTAFQEANLLVEPVKDYLEVGEDPQAWANGYLVKVPYPDDGEEMPMVGSPVHLSKTPARIDKMAPQFGQHTEEVLLEAGFTWEDISGLQERGAFGSPPD